MHLRLLAYIKPELAARSWEAAGAGVSEEAPVDPERSLLLCRRSVFPAEARTSGGSNGTVFIHQAGACALVHCLEGQ